MKSITKTPVRNYFGDFTKQIDILREQVRGLNVISTQLHIRNGGNPNTVSGLIDERVPLKAFTNRFGKFYGLRSKYDGRGNKREPLKA